jgi:hypothetical protein
MRRVILKCDHSASTIVMLTAAVRDLHSSCSGQFQTDVRTRYPELWRNNPHLTRLDLRDPGVEQIDCNPWLAQRSDDPPFHFIHGFLRHLGTLLDIEIKPTLFRGDLHLSRREKSWMSQVQELTGDEIPFWIVSAGGTFEKTIKWWEHERFQAVVDAFRDRILFVQVGAQGDHHPALNGVVDLRGKTDLRQLVRLVHHAQGLLCPLNLLMHLSAAVETKHDLPNRACVVISGGGQSTQWQRYPTHQFLHTIGSLTCCDITGCGRHRTRSLGDKSPSDLSDKICVDVVNDLPHCMHMIGAADVIRSIQRYFDGGVLNYLAAGEIEVTRRSLAGSAHLSGSIFEEKLAPRELPAFMPQDQL